MSPEAQRVAIAEACGWMRATRLGKDVLYDPSGGHILIVDAHNHLPDYLNDLNAMNEAEVRLFGAEQKRFRREIVDICQTPEDAIYSHAGQRAEAFLKAVGRWTD